VCPKRQIAELKGAPAAGGRFHYWMNQLARRLWVGGGLDLKLEWVEGVGVSYLTTVIVAGAVCTHEIRLIDKQCK